MIKAGTLCVWQNLTGAVSYLNGSDIIAETGLKYVKGHEYSSGNILTILGYETKQQILMPNGKKGTLFAAAHNLREKFPPQDEEDLIKEKELEHG